MNRDDAYRQAKKVWQIIEDSSGYGFNASHSYCVAGDSIYCAYLKSHYPFEFYKILLESCIKKGKKDIEKLSKIKSEMYNAFGIKSGEIKFGKDNREFTIDKKNKVIYQSLLSVKNMNKTASNKLYNLGTKNIDCFTVVYEHLLKEKIDSRKVDILIKIGYFSDYGNIQKLLSYIKMHNQIKERKKIETEKFREMISEYAPNYDIEKIIGKFCEVDIFSVKTYPKNIEFNKINKSMRLKEIFNSIKDKDAPLKDKIKFEMEYLGYVQTKLSEMYYGKIQAISQRNSSVLFMNIKTREVKWYRIKRGKDLPQKDDLIQVNGFGKYGIENFEVL